MPGGSPRPGRPLVHAVTAWLFLLGIVAQIYLAGSGLFAHRGDLTSHREFAGMVVLLAVILFGGAGLGGTRFADVNAAAILIVLVIVQSLLPSQRETAPLVASLHPLVGSLLMVAAVSVTIRTTRRAIVRWRDSRAGPQDGQT